MNLFPVIVRELRAESRRPSNYWLRALAAGTLVLACVLAFWSHQAFLAEQRRIAAMFAQSFGRGWGGPMPTTPSVPDPNGMSALGSLLFGNANAALFATLWLLVPLLTADCINREKRDGTLGLLFLTPLTATGVVAGKCFVHGLRALTLFLTMLPVLALPVVLGGVSGHDVLLAVLLNANALILALGAGLLASCLAKDSVRTILLAEVISLMFAAMFMSLHRSCFQSILIPLVAASPPNVPTFLGLQSYYGVGLLSWCRDLFVFHTNLASSGGQMFWGAVPTMNGPWAQFWAKANPSQVAEWFRLVGLLLGGSLLSFWLCVMLASAWVRRSWREIPRSAAAEALQKAYCAPRFLNRIFRRKQRRALADNPIAWLQQYSVGARLTKWGWCLFVVIAETVLVQGWSEMATAQWYLSIAVLGGLAFAAAASFRPDRESGTLELLLVTPLRPSYIMSGRLIGLWLQFLPAVILLILSWTFAENSLQTGRYGSSSDFEWERLGPVLLFSTFLTLPVSGLYFSLNCRFLLTGWLMTFLLGLVLPLLLGAGTTAILDSQASAHHHQADLISSFLYAVILTQVTVATLIGGFVPVRIRQVAADGVMP